MRSHFVVVSVFLLVGSAALAQNLEFLPLNFNLESIAGSTKSDCAPIASSGQNLRNLTGVVTDTKFIKEMKPVARIVESKRDRFGKQVEEITYLYATANHVDPPRDRNRAVLGMLQREALWHSRDDFNTTAFSEGHDQGDTANRWTHATTTMLVAHGAEKAGVPRPVASAIGTAASYLKEKKDLNLSAHDLVFSYEDRLGTKRSTFRITVFGDMVCDSHCKKFELGKGSLPFFQWSRKLGPYRGD